MNEFDRGILIGMLTIIFSELGGVLGLLLYYLLE